jgi:hypothetical protein
MFGSGAVEYKTLRLKKFLGQRMTHSLLFDRGLRPSPGTQARFNGNRTLDEIYHPVNSVGLLLASQNDYYHP